MAADFETLNRRWKRNKQRPFTAKQLDVLRALEEHGKLQVTSSSVLGTSVPSNVVRALLTKGLVRPCGTIDDYGVELTRDGERFLRSLSGADGEDGT